MNSMNAAEATPASKDSHTLVARLDRLPVMGAHYLWTLVLAANLMLEYYDNAMFAYAIPTVKAHTGMTTQQVGLIGSAFFVGQFIGALAGGRFSDLWGRRTVLVWFTVLYSLGALLTAYAPNYEAMLASRVITGIGVQAATSTLLVYIAEMFPGKARGRFVSLVTVGFVVSGIGAATLAMYYLPHSGPDTWRHLMLAGSVGLLIAPVARLALPESVRWYVSRGHLWQADQIVSHLEARALRQGPLSEPKVVPRTSGVQQATLRELLGNKAVLRTILVVSGGYFGATLAYYLFINWGTYALIYGLKYPEEQAYEVAFLWNVAYIVTPFLTYLFLDRWERKTTILATSALSAAPLVVLGVSSSSWVMVAAGGAASIITGLVINAYFTYIPETIPTRMRALGSGIVISAGRCGGIASGVAGAALFSSGSMAAVMGLAAACYVVFSIPVLLLGPRTTNRSLEAVAEDVAEEEIGGLALSH